MSIWHCLVTVAPLRTSDDTRYTIRAASANDRAITGLNGVVWDPCLTEAPSLSISLFGGDFTDAISLGSAKVPLNMESLKASYPDADGCDWSGAAVEIYAGKSGDAWPWTKVFSGTVSDYARSGQTLTLSADVNTEPFNADQLPNTYAGTGGAEGDANLKDKVKPLVIGWAQNVEPLLINATDSVYQFSGYGAIEAVSALYERGSDFGASSGDYADYAALVAATIAPGQWASCLAEGLVRLGAPAYGLITGDVKGHAVSGTTPRLTGAVISALADIAGVDSGLIETATLTALDADVPYHINLVLTDQASFADTARRLALPCNYQAGVSLLGTFFVTKISLAASPSLTLDAQGHSSPQVAEASEAKTSPPYARMIFGANRCWRVHTFDEIAFYAPLVDMGLWDAATTYREGNIVHLADGSQWLYTNTTPTAGNVPGPGSAYWSSLNGVSTERYPTDPPTGVVVGSIYYDENNHPYRFEGLALYNGDNQLFCGALELDGSGYVSVRDKSLAEIVAALESVDDDNVLTVDEKIRIVIPESARLEAQYQGALARANLLGLDVTTLTNAREAWLEARDSLSPAWNDTSQDTPITRLDWDSTLDTYRTAIEEALTAITSPTAVTVFPPATQVVQRDQTGAAISGEFPRTLATTVKRGDADVTTDDDTSYSISTSNVTATIDNTTGSGTKGQITVTASSADGYIDITVVVGAVTYGPYRVAFTTTKESLTKTYETSSAIAFHFKSGSIDFILQMGTGTIAGNTTTTVSFPETYTTKCFFIAAGGSNDPSREGDVHAYSNSLSNGSLINTQGVSCFYTWIALGY